MSFQTGQLLNCTTELEQFLVKSKQTESDVRLFKVLIDIEAEKLVLANINPTGTGSYFPICGSWEEDYERYLPGVLAADSSTEPCYLFLRTNEPHSWIFIHFCPESCRSVRSKMLYSSSKYQLKQQFGSNHIVWDFFADTADVLRFEVFHEQWLAQRSQAAGGGEEDDEDEGVEKLIHLNMNSLSITESTVQKSQNSNSKINFGLSEQVNQALHRFRDGALSYVKLKIGPSEQILVDTTGDGHHLSNVLDVRDKVHHGQLLLPPSTNNAQADDNLGFHLLRFSYLDPQGSPTRAISLVVVIPLSTKVRQRFIYSSALGSLQNSIADLIKPAQIDKRIEVDDSAEATFGYVTSKLYPEAEEGGDGGAAAQANELESTQLKFNKPALPGRKGPRRLIK